MTCSACGEEIDTTEPHYHPTDPYGQTYDFHSRCWKLYQEVITEPEFNQ